MLNISQKTINSKISCNSLGLHSGVNVNMTLLPAPCNSGIIFRRTDVEKDKNEVIIEGDPDKIKTVTDYWKFSKNSSSNNPNWYLAEIISK